MDDVWLSAVTDKITQNVSNKHSWLKLNWERVSVEGEFPRTQGDSDSFSCLILVQKSELKEAIEKLDATENATADPEYMDIFIDSDEEFVFLEINDIDQGQFSMFKPFKMFQTL